MLTEGSMGEQALVIRLLTRVTGLFSISETVNTYWHLEEENLISVL